MKTSIFVGYLFNHIRKFFLLTSLRLLVGSFLLVGLLSSCNFENEIVPALGELMRFSVLAVNLQGIQESYGTGFIPWRERYERIGVWMEQNGKTPDVIALQETYADKTGLNPYDTLFTLTTSFNAHTGANYRIAYLIVRPVPQGLQETLWAGQAVIYNANRINNRTIASTLQIPYNDESQLGPHPRTSFPCIHTSPQFSTLCSLIDSSGLAWVSAYRQSGTNRWIWGPVFARFEIRDAPNAFVDTYNIHLQYDPQSPPHTPEVFIREINALLSRMDNSAGRLYPPILIGDFNIGVDDIVGAFPNFDVAGFAPNGDVMGVLVGKSNAFPSSQNAYHSALTPGDMSHNPGTSYCGNVGTLWGDHCGIYVEFRPIPTT